jgi:hypothetical protein
MREEVNAQRIESFMKSLGFATRQSARVYFVGGATAVMLGWRESTIDVDLKLLPDADTILRVLPQLKERLNINVELAAPDDFIPALPGWQERSRFISKEGSIEYFHYDFYSQALAKIERGHNKDRADIWAMIETGLVEPERLLQLFGDIEPQLFRYPAIDPSTFRRAVEDIVNESTQNQGTTTSPPDS